MIRDRVIIRLAEIKGTHEAGCGAKAVSLARMRRLGLLVPGGFCILSAAYREHLKSNNLTARLSSTLRILDNASPEARRDFLSQLRKDIIDAPLSESFRVEVEGHYRELGAAQLAVRSSATAEDLPGHSFAGQYDTYLGMTSFPDCLEAVKKCWASLWTDRAYEYRKKNNFDHMSAEMAVVVQELIVAEASGVVFTADPLTGKPDRLVVEACFGLGKALVSGKVTPDRFVLAKGDLRVLTQSISEKAVQVIIDSTGTIREQPISPARSHLPSINESAAARLGELAKRAESVFHSPQDMEWAMKANDIFFLQSRPITTLASARSFEDRQVWTNLNAGEVVPDVVTPMTWSLAAPVVVTLFNSILWTFGLNLGENPIIGQIAGRTYFNLNTAAGALRRIPGSNETVITRIFGGEQERMAQLGQLEFSEQDIPDFDFSLLRMVRNMPRLVYWAVALPSRKREKFVTDMRKEVEELSKVNLLPLSDADIAALIQSITDDLIDVAQSIAFAGLGMLFLSLLEKVCEKWVGDADRTFANRLLAGMGGMESAEAGLELWRLALKAHETPAVEEAILSGESWGEVKEKLTGIKGSDEFQLYWERFIAEHGHHTRGEIELYNPRWSEAPDYILGMVRGYLRSIGSVHPIENYRERAQEREKLVKNCRQRLRNPFKRLVFNFSLAQAQRGSLIRENMKSVAVRFLAVLRSQLRELGERLASKEMLENSDDIFFLTLEEIGPIAHNAAGFNVKEVVASRRAEYERNLTITPPKVVIGTFNPDNFIPDVDEVGGEVLSGLPVSPGVVAGPARVILRAHNDEHVLPGEILVAPFTDPGWTPYFMTAAAIVMDMGGMLSHGCIIAREYGIPAVVNVGSATKLIKTGQMIQVDGNRGRVTILR